MFPKIRVPPQICGGSVIGRCDTPTRSSQRGSFVIRPAELASAFLLLVNLLLRLKSSKHLRRSGQNQRQSPKGHDLKAASLNKSLCVLFLFNKSFGFKPLAFTNSRVFFFLHLGLLLTERCLHHWDTCDACARSAAAAFGGAPQPLSYLQREALSGPPGAPRAHPASLAS